MRILNLYIYIKEQSLCRHFYPGSDVLNVAAHIKNWKYWMEIARILFNSGRFCRYVTMLLSVKNGDRIGFCELSKAGLRLSCFLLFFSSWRWGSREKKRERDGVFYTGRYLKILFFPLEIAATWCCSRSGKEAAAVRTAPLHKRRTHCCRPAAWRHSKAWTRVKGLPKRLTSEYLPGPSNYLLVYSLPKRNNGPYLLGRQDTPSGTGIIYTYLVCPECSCM